MKFTARMLHLLIKIMMRSKLHCQKVLRLKIVSYKTLRTPRGDWLAASGSGYEVGNGSCVGPYGRQCRRVIASTRTR